MHLENGAKGSVITAHKEGVGLGFGRSQTPDILYPLYHLKHNQFFCDSWNGETMFAIWDTHRRGTGATYMWRWQQKHQLKEGWYRRRVSSRQTICDSKQKVENGWWRGRCRGGIPLDNEMGGVRSVDSKCWRHLDERLPARNRRFGWCRSWLVRWPAFSTEISVRRRWSRERAETYGESGWWEVHFKGFLTVRMKMRAAKEGRHVCDYPEAYT